jgi:hypothetical protein
MPWNECDYMSEEIKFISRLFDGKEMTNLCRELVIVK